ncbi:hypothetical protein C8R45DRAFT_809437 [Mycena sanguinolenta]|nr:hypothetical protein C8R45DRAFT_809437 [Mycena sanguinolenta]
MRILGLISLFLPFLSRVIAQGETQTTFQIFADPSDIYPLPSSPSCASALSATLSCDANILFALPSSTNGVSNLTSAELASLCNTACYTSLINAGQAADKACVGWPYIVGETSYVASFPFQYLAYNWNLTCVMTGSQFCLNQVQNSTSTTETDISALPKAQLCTDCFLKPLNIQMTSPFGWDASFVTEWKAIQSTCGVTFNNTMPNGLLLDPNVAAQSNATTYNVTATPTLPPASTSNCVFGTYTVKAGDTCQSIAFANSLSIDQFIATNGLDISCTKLPAAGQPICLSGHCTLYNVQSGDTCVSIYEKENVTWSELLAWNPQIDNYCSNIATQVGKGICVSPPGGGYTFTDTGAQTSGTPTAIAIPTGVIAPGSNRQNCGEWYEAQPGDTCPQILILFQLTNDTFYDLNPDVNGDCSNLLAGFEYCVAIFGSLTTTSAISFPTSTFASVIDYQNGDFPQGTGFVTASGGNVTVTAVTGSPPPATAPPQASETFTVASGSLGNSSCLQYRTRTTGDSCLAIEALFDITDEQFHQWNPEVTSSCSNIEIGLAYCVYGPVSFTTPTVTATPVSSSSSSMSASATSSAPTNVASGTITMGCTQYYTVVSGDSCGAIESKFAITLSQFLTWNPEVNSQCTNILVGLAYCVTGPTSSSSSAPVSSPTASGTITTGCTTYYTVVSGDSCGAIESKFGISFAQFQAWNPEVNSACSNILVGFEYCVAGRAYLSPFLFSSLLALTPITSGCNQYYTVVSGDSCPAIESKFSITFAQFQTWNPEVNSACSNILVGFEYCVSGPAVSSSAPAAPTASGSLTTAQGCTKYYTTISGDTCSKIETTGSITLAQFLKWNPEINTGCTNLQVGVEVCFRRGNLCIVLMRTNPSIVLRDPES